MVVDQLARHLRKAGHEPVVLAPDRSLWRTTREPDVPYPVKRHRRFVSMRKGIRWYAAWLQRWQRRQPFDVIHCHGVYPTAYACALVKPRLGCPILVTSHGEDGAADHPHLTDPTLRPRYRHALEQADALICISGQTRAGYLALDPTAAGRIHDIPNGVDVDSFATPVDRPRELNPAIASRQYVLFLGRLASRKGPDLLIRAMAATQGSGPLHLVVAGDGPQWTELQQLTASCGLSRRVHFCGSVWGRAKTYLLQNALAVAMPSRVSEGLPLVALEAFAAGKPVIASDVPGLNELVRPNRTGWLFPENSVAALSAAIRQVMADPGSAERLGRQARETAASYHWPKIALRHVELYQHAIGNRAASAARGQQAAVAAL